MVEKSYKLCSYLGKYYNSPSGLQFDLSHTSVIVEDKNVDPPRRLFTAHMRRIQEVNHDRYFRSILQLTLKPRHDEETGDVYYFVFAREESRRSAQAYIKSALSMTDSRPSIQLANVGEQYYTTLRMLGKYENCQLVIQPNDSDDESCSATSSPSQQEGTPDPDCSAVEDQSNKMPTSEGSVAEDEEVSGGDKDTAPVSSLERPSTDESAGADVPDTAAQKVSVTPAPEREDTAKSEIPVTFTKGDPDAGNDEEVRDLLQKVYDLARNRSKHSEDQQALIAKLQTRVEEKTLEAASLEEICLKLRKEIRSLGDGSPELQTKLQELKSSVKDGQDKIKGLLETEARTQAALQRANDHLAARLVEHSTYLGKETRWEEDRKMLKNLLKHFSSPVLGLDVDKCLELVRNGQQIQEAVIMASAVYMREKPASVSERQERRPSTQSTSEVGRKRKCGEQDHIKAVEERNTPDGGAEMPRGGKKQLTALERSMSIKSSSTPPATTGQATTGQAT